MELLSAGTAVAGQEALKIILTDIYQSSKSRFQKLKIDRINKHAAESIYQKLRSVENVKTIWRVDEEVNLNDFYYPSKIKVSGSKDPIEPKLISDITERQNIVIEGTAGQGKSILLRYLASNEIKNGLKIPLFIELRKIGEIRSLIPSIQEKLSNLGFESSNVVVNELLASGKVIVLLDGFDEVSSNDKTPLLSSLEDLICRYPNTIFTVTSRPGSGIQNSEYFRVVKINPLDRSDHKNFLRKVCSSESQAETIHQAISFSTVEIQGLLTTPLLLTLLTILYKSEQKVPDNLIDFYNKLFYILFTKHDSSKPGFKREVMSDLTESKFEELFEHFCFLTRRRQKTLLPVEIARKFVRDSLELSKINTDEHAFLSDCCNITCLLIEEGTDYQFIHKSVQEFYSAKFIAKRNESISRRFYETCIKQYTTWEQELKFLKNLDTYRYNKFFLIPAISNIKSILSEKEGGAALFRGSSMILNENGNITQISSIATNSILQYTSEHVLDIMIHTESLGLLSNKPFLSQNLIRSLVKSGNAKKMRNIDKENLFSISTWDALGCKDKLQKHLLLKIKKRLDDETKEANEYIENEDNLEARIFRLD